MKSPIKSVSIYGFLGKNDIHIPFENENKVKILVGENGIGKTQVLNIFYCAFTSNISKLLEYNFERIELFFEAETIEISKTKIAKMFSGIWNSSSITNPRFDKLGFDKVKEYISNNTILYFPTFRRIEEDLNSLGYNNKSKNPGNFTYEDQKISYKESSIEIVHFGMKDVQERFDYVENKIDLLLQDGFTKISSEILSKLIKGFEDANQEILNEISEGDMNIILARVGSQITDTEKEKIKEIVLNRNTLDVDNSLLYIIKSLVEIYGKQKEIDKSINNFKNTCNTYLTGKKIFYDESNIKIYIQLDGSEESLPLDKLSSGEKQIISIFSKIYLSEGEQRFIVLFDEPELSLSMPWQKKLLPDILASDKCDFLLAVTHSPFIFDNELDRYAIGLNEYIQPQDKVIA